MKKTMKNTLMMKGLVLVLAICFIAFGGVLSVSADDDEDSVIAVGKDVTVTYSPENDGGFISFYPDNAGYQCYRISGEVEKGSNSQIKVYAAACHGGQQESFGTDEELSMSNPKSSFWTTSLKKEDGYDNGIEVWTNIGYRDLEGSVTVKWHIEKLIGLNDTLKKSMKSAKTVQIKKTGTVSKKISKLKAKKKYYVRIRTYKTVNKTNYYSDWSKIKTVKTK